MSIMRMYNGEFTPISKVLRNVDGAFRDVTKVLRRDGDGVFRQVFGVDVSTDILIHCWDAKNYDATTYSIPDTGTASEGDVKFDFVTTASMASGMEFGEDYITVGPNNYFSIVSNIATQANWGKNVRLEFEWEFLTDATLANNGLADFGSVVRTVTGQCQRAITITPTRVGFQNIKFNSNTWFSLVDFEVPTPVNIPINTVTRYHDTWLSNGETIVFTKYLNDAAISILSTNLDADLSWDRFGSQPWYLGRGVTTGYAYPYPWKFRSLKIYKMDDNTAIAPSILALIELGVEPALTEAERLAQLAELGVEI